MSVAELRRVVQAQRELPPPAERRALREAAGVSLAMVARAVGVSRQAVMAWERGRTPRPPFLFAYLRVLKAFEDDEPLSAAGP